ncbi:DUF4412 domain-containing protein [Fodinibius sediminis]|uniref:DUF4412 domain-containing protein n=1 Tax=Fodinibius sediminis TaxID=1214077 RepID=A0A521AMX2_9BACT|nr:DUF4412 domain-containing protein [Fodinibius sediminis]SMO36184.1 protein of unknown function [Fodinibius sediminis]
MKQRHLICTFILALAALMGIPQTGHAQNFEGVIHYEFAGTAESGMGEIPYMVKDDKIRMQFGNGQAEGAMIFLPEESKMLFVLDNMKSYMNMDMNEWTDESNYDSKWDESEMTKTGETRTVAGYDCEIWQVTNSSGDHLTMCMAEGLGTFMSPGNPMARQNAPAWAREIVTDGYMPLEVVEESGNGDRKVHMKANKIEEKSLDDALFEVPSGYRDMSAMMKQMMQQRN